jgi:diguanylate cyclase (GGDEF)-like protein/PAS domain S-box-containing protein
MSVPMKKTALRQQPLAGHDGPELLAALETNRFLRNMLEEVVGERESIEAERRAWIEERRLLRAMIDQVPDYLFAKDTQSRFVVANKAVAADLGYDPEGLLGKSDLELHPAEIARDFYANEQRIIRVGEPILDHEEYVVRPNGERRWLSTSKAPLRNDDGEIVGLVGISRDITNRKLDEARVRHMAYHDQLTGLANRARFEVELRDTIERKGRAFLLLVDLDGFKHVNDTHGHAAGDDLLRQVGERLSHLALPDGFVSRMGGDEFAIILDARRPLAATCEAIARGLSQSFQLSGKTANIGASIGTAPIHEAPSASEALRRADIALYAAKGAGRGRWQFYERAMGEVLERRLRLQGELSASIATDQIFAMYQPVYRADGRTPAGAEALVRWRHPVMGLLPPSQFISIAEETGLIHAIGERMLKSACAFLATHPSVPWIAVNVSTVQLHSDTFAASTLAAIRAANIDPARIQLEITESVLLQDAGAGRLILEKLAAAGVRIALDDFGTGYSSLNYLRRFPVNKIKIDRSFVSEIGSRSADAIVNAIVALARGLDMTVTAEGVETEAQRAFLESAGCHEVQGYLMSRPLAEDQLAAALR